MEWGWGGGFPGAQRTLLMFFPLCPPSIPKEETTGPPEPSLAEPRTQLSCKVEASEWFLP